MALDKEGLHIGDPNSITTATGLRFDPLHPDPALIDIEDIARALSRQCRYNGHVGGFLSVARHSLWVSEYLSLHHPKLALDGLLHDAAEAYLGDLVRPLKATAFGAVYVEMEAQLEAVLFPVFGVTFPLAEEVKEADRWVLMNREIGEGSARDNWYSAPEWDEKEFLNRFTALGGAYHT